MNLILLGLSLMAFLEIKYPDESQRVKICDLATNECVVKYVKRDKYGNWIVPEDFL